MTDSRRTTVVSLTVVTEVEEHVTKAAEAFARIAAGLVLDGITVNLNLGQVDDDS